MADLVLRAPELYQRLRVPQDASRRRIQRAYKWLAMTMHPDQGGAADAWYLVQEAYEVLNDQAARRRYDDTGTFTPRSSDGAASARLAGIVEQIMENLISGDAQGTLPDLEHSDIPDLVVTQLSSMRGTLAQQVEAAGRALARARSLQARLGRRRKKGQDTLRIVLEQKVTRLELQLADALEAQSVHEQVIELWGAATYKWEEAPAYDGGPWSGVQVRFAPRRF